MVRLVILFYLQIIIAFTKIQLLYLAEDEYYLLSRQALVISTNETEIVENEFSNIETLKKNSKTLSKQLSSLYKHQEIVSDYIKVITSLQYNKSAIDICFSKFGSIECKYRIMNQLVDENLVILDNHQYTLFFEKYLCEQLHNIQINKFIIQCRSLQGMIIALINDKSEILDSLLIEPIYNQTQNSIFKDQNLIVYETLDSYCALSMVGWSTDYNYLQIKQITLNGKDYVDLKDVGQVNNVQLQESNVVIIYFSYFTLHFNLLNFSITTPFILKNDHEVQYFQFIQLSQLNSQIMIYLDNKIQNTFEIGNKEFRINPKLKKIESVQYINENIIIQFQSFLYIVNNQFIYDVMETEISQVLYLENLPFILLQGKQGQLLYYKINSFPFYLKYQQSTYLSVFWCIDMSIHQQSTVYKIVLLPKNVTILLNNDPINFKILDSTQSLVTYHYKNKMLGYPSQVTDIVDKHGVVSEIYNSDLISSNVSRNTIFLIQNNFEIYPKITFHQNQTLTISDDMNKIYLKHSYRFNLNESQFFISPYKSSFIVQDKQTLYCYSYINTEIKVSQINFEKKINYLVQQGDLLFILFENCSQIMVEFSTFKLIQQENSLQVNCTEISNDQLNIQITSSQIDILRKNNYIQSLRFHQIVRVQYFINYYKLIIFELVENLLQLKHYQVKNNQYYFLHKLPTYSYIIDYPLKYKILMQMFAILAHNEEKDQFVLIYDLHNKASNSMISIIQVDENCHIYNFLSPQKFFYIYKNELRIQYLNSVNIQFKSDLFKGHLNSYFYTTHITLIFDPKYVRNNNSVTLNLQFFNNYQRIELLTDKLQSYFVYNSTKILPLYDVFGRITSVTYFSNDKQYNLTSFSIVDQQKCLLFKQKSCILRNNEIIIDSFDLRLKLQLNNKQIINGFTLVKSEFNIFIYTIDEEQVLNIHNFTIQGKLIEEGRIQTNFQQDTIILNSLQVVGNFIVFDTINKQTKSLFLIQNYQIQQFLINNYNEFQFISIHKTPNFYFISYEATRLIQNNESLTFLFLSQQFDILTQKVLKFREILHYDIKNDLVKLKDTKFVLDDDNFQFELLICFINLHCYYMQFKFDFQFKFFEQKIVNTIRIQKQYLLKNIEFFSSKYIILSFNQFEKIKYIYHLNQSNKFIIDSHQQIELEDYQVNKYNDTYFTIFTQNPDCDVKLFQLHNYYVPCQQACDDQQVNVLLQNEVNQLNLTFINHISNEDQISLQNIKSQQIIIFITGVILFLYLCKTQKKQKK